MPARTLLLFQTHYLDRALERAFRRLARQAPPHFECRVLVHLPPGRPAPARLSRVPHHLVRTDELRAMPYPRKTADADWTGRPWEMWGGGHCDLIALHGMLAHPGFDRYWVMEYDVAFTGDWGRFFAAFEGSDADLLTTCIRERADDPAWVCWPSLQGGAHGDAAQAFATAAFLPLWRVSARLVAAMDAAYRDGYGGHVEASWSSLARARGMKLEDIGGDGPFVAEGNRRRFYTASPSTALQFYLAPGTFFAKPHMYRPGRRRDTLWHPVKPWHWGDEFRAALREWRIIGGAWKLALREWLSRRHGGAAPG
ncbi:hypothetical protein [Falsiroseomonas sp. CW058]|uniref:hypothetical protein n=1 Tax=Falsiroseomonas sp. CW058 TaxID=3388664 RepID=UPI003D311DA2